MKTENSSFIILLTALTLCIAATPCVAQDRFAQLNAPISFYGKAVDQKGEPVASAKVTAEAVTVRGWDETESKPMTVQTADDGTFQMTGITGYSLENIRIEKDGYQLSPKTVRGYVFGVTPNYKPDPKNPVVFKMWKLAGKERLVGTSWHGGVACDGEAKRFDLLHGNPDAIGDLEIMCWKHPLTVPPPGNAHFDYKFEIAVLGGGVQPTPDEFTYRAPETGYNPTFVISRKAEDPGWYGGVKQEFYIKTKDGHYGRLYVEWYASQTPPVHLEWNCTINPSGSRNLER